MNPKCRKPLILFIASFALIGFGMLLKVMHWFGTAVAGTLFGAGMLVQLFSIVWLIYVILRPGKD
jgi:hypothetical protein